jgi:hypothetical protein
MANDKASLSTDVKKDFVRTGGVGMHTRLLTNLRSEPCVDYRKMAATFEAIDFHYEGIAGLAFDIDLRFRAECATWTHRRNAIKSIAAWADDDSGPQRAVTARHAATRTWQQPIAICPVYRNQRKCPLWNAS